VIANTNVLMITEVPVRADEEKDILQYFLLVL